MTSPATSPSRSDQQSRALAPLVTAFSQDPMMRWVYPDPQQYLAHFPTLARHLGGQAFETGTADSTEDFMATALWLPPGVAPDEQALGALVQQTVPEPKQEAIFATVESLNGYHPEEPHWYLPFIGVDPARQGRGLGSMLLKRALERCDAEHSAAYLESSNERNIPLYERHGFELVGETKVKGAPPLWPMLRKAR